MRKTGNGISAYVHGLRNGGQTIAGSSITRAQRSKQLARWRVVQTMRKQCQLAIRKPKLDMVRGNRTTWLRWRSSIVAFLIANFSSLTLSDTIISSTPLPPGNPKPLLVSAIQELGAHLIALGSAQPYGIRRIRKDLHLAMISDTGLSRPYTARSLNP